MERIHGWILAGIGFVIAAMGGQAIGILLVVVGIVVSVFTEYGSRAKKPPHTGKYDDWGYPIHDTAPAFPVQPKTGLSRYRIVGVDKETRMEVTDTIEATTADNARVKAELSGVVVTSVQPA